MLEMKKNSLFLECYVDLTTEARKGVRRVFMLDLSLNRRMFMLGT